MSTLDLDSNPLQIIQIPADQEVDSHLFSALNLSKLQNLRVYLYVQLGRHEYTPDKMMESLQQQAHLRGQLDLIERLINDNYEARKIISSSNQAQGQQS